MNGKLPNDKFQLTYPNKRLKRDKGDGLSNQHGLPGHQQAFNNRFHIGIAQQLRRSPIGKAHQGKYISPLVAHACYIAQGAIKDWQHPSPRRRHHSSGK